MITKKAPGKLYIAGEYAIVEPGSKAIVLAINQFVTASIEESKNDSGKIISKQYQNDILSWRRKGSSLIVNNRENPYHYILSAISITEEYALLQNKCLKTFNLYINSELDSKDGKKYGLGSSAAVTVATIKAVAAFYNLKLTKKILFKLASIAHLTVQGNGSLGDIAASVYGGWIAYQSFNRDWLLNSLENRDLKYILNTEWPDLNVELLSLPSDLKLCIGWTGHPASTSELVDEVASKGYQETKNYHDFIKKSNDCLDRLIKSFKASDSQNILNGITENRHLLQGLSQFSKVTIETDLLTKLCDIAEHFGGAGKSSGAGGGDCGIALLPKKINVSKLKSTWIANNIVPLDLNVHEVLDLS